MELQLFHIIIIIIIIFCQPTAKTAKQTLPNLFSSSGSDGVPISRSV